MRDVSHPSGHETTDADPRLIGALAAGLTVFLALTPLLMLALFPGSPDAGTTARAPSPPQPRLQVKPKADLIRQRREEHARLETAGWADSGHQIIHIPIERAMQLVAARGLPGWPVPR